MSFDPVEKNRAFAEKFKFPFRLLSDTTRRVGMAYGAATDPDAGSARRITYLVGADGRIEQVYAKVSVRQHAAEILAAQDEAHPR